MARPAVVSSGSDAYAVVEHAVFPVPTALYRTLHESSGCAADGRRLVELVQRERESAIDTIANKEKRRESRVSRDRSRGR